MLVIPQLYHPMKIIVYLVDPTRAWEELEHSIIEGLRCAVGGVLSTAFAREEEKRYNARVTNPRIDGRKALKTWTAQMNVVRSSF